MTNGFTIEQVAAVLMRDGGMCMMTGAGSCSNHLTANHRLNRKAGGSKLRNGMGNACAICDHHNDRIESDAEAAEVARERGVKLREGQDPEITPMWHPFYRQWTQPTDTALLMLGLVP